MMEHCCIAFVSNRPSLFNRTAEMRVGFCVGGIKKCTVIDISILSGLHYRPERVMGSSFNTEYILSLSRDPS